MRQRHKGHSFGFGLGAVILVVVTFAIFSQFIMASSSSNTVAANLHTSNTYNSLPTAGSLGSKLITEDGVEITLLNVERHGTQLFFHFRAYNSGKQAIQLVGTKDDYQFYFDKVGTFTRTPAISGSDLATHPAFSSKLATHASADGWVMIDTRAFKTSPTTVYVLYRFGGVPGTSCTNPQVQSTCHAEVIFEAVTWKFQL